MYEDIQYIFNIVCVICFINIITKSLKIILIYFLLFLCISFTYFIIVDKQLLNIDYYKKSIDNINATFIDNFLHNVYTKFVRK